MQKRQPKKCQIRKKLDFKKKVGNNVSKKHAKKAKMQKKKMKKRPYKIFTFTKKT